MYFKDIDIRGIWVKGILKVFTIFETFLKSKIISE